MERLEELYNNYIKYKDTDKISETTKRFMEGDITTSRTFLKESLEDIIKYQLPAPVEIKEWLAYLHVKEHIGTKSKKQIISTSPTSMNMTKNVIRWYEIEIYEEGPTPMERLILEHYMNGKEIKEISKLLKINKSTARNAIMALEFPRIDFKPAICNIRDNFNLQTFTEWDLKGKGEDYLESIGFHYTEYSTVYNMDFIKDKLYAKRKNIILSSFKEHNNIIEVSKDTGYSSYLVKRILQIEGEVDFTNAKIREDKRFYGKAVRAI